MNVSQKYLAIIKQEVLSDLSDLIREVDWSELAVFNKAYRSYQDDPYRKLIEAELPVWELIVDLFLSQRSEGCSGVLDIGTFFPYYPVVLKKVGYETEVIEKTSLYGGAYRPIKDYLDREKIKLNELDIIGDSLDILPHGYDIFLCSVLEHLNGSPRYLIEKIKPLMSSESLLYIVVPNICNAKKIWGMMRGGSPLPDYQMYWQSAYPFEGHNREMTGDELTLLCQLSELEIVAQGVYVHPIQGDKLTLKSRIRNYIFQGVKKICPGYADTIWVIVRKMNPSKDRR